MAERGGIADVLLAFSIISGILLVSDYLNRPKAAAVAKAREQAHQAKLDAISRHLALINEKLAANR